MSIYKYNEHVRIKSFTVNNFWVVEMIPITFQSTFDRHLRGWRIWGVLPQSTDGNSYKIVSFVVHCVLWFFITCIWLSLVNAETVADVIDIFILATTFVLAYIKTAISLIHKRKINDIVLLVKHLEVNTANRPIEQNCLREAEKRSRNLYYLMIGVCFTGVAVFNAQAFVNRTLTFKSLYPFDWDTTPTRYYLTLLFQVTCNYLTVFVIPCVDTYGPAMWSFLASYIDILRNRLSKLGSSNGISERDLERDLVDCVRYHVHIIQ